MCLWYLDYFSIKEKLRLAELRVGVSVIFYFLEFPCRFSLTPSSPQCTSDGASC